MTHKIIIVLAFVFLSLTVFSQSFGLRAGVNVANLAGDVEDNAAIIAYQAGAFVDFSLGSVTDLNIALLYSKKGARNEIEDVNANLHYLEIPVLFRFTIGAIFLEVGPYGSYALSADVDGMNIKDIINNGDYGLIFGAGVIIGKFRFDARYSFGMANISELDLEEIKNSVITFGAEFKF